MEQYREPLERIGMPLVEAIETDGKPVVITPMWVSQNPVIPWYGGNSILSGGGAACTSGFSWILPSLYGNHYYTSTAGHCAFWPVDTPTPASHHAGYWYEPWWPGIDFTQLMNNGSVACCPPMRWDFDISLFHVNGPLGSRPSPLSHRVTNYCPGGCQRNFNTTTYTVTGSLSGTLVNGTILTKSGQTTGTSSGSYGGIEPGMARGRVNSVSGCGVWPGDSGSPVFTTNGTNITGVGMLSSAAGGAPTASPANCGNPQRHTAYNFVFLNNLSLATGAFIVTNTTP